MTLTTEQAAAVEAEGSVAVLAGAGAGKTHMLAARYVRHLAVHELRPLEVVAVTFTDKAAGELRARIRAEVREALPGRPDYLAELEAAPISTLHALAARICREHPEEAGVPADFTILDPLEGEIWRLGEMEQAFDALPEPAGAPVPYGLLRDALEAFLKDPLTAEAALAVDPETWRARFEAARAEALATFLADPALRAARADLDMYEGAGPVETFRRQALGALVRLLHPVGGQASREDVESALVDLAACKPGNQGKASDWPQGGCKEVKDAIKVAREAAAKAQKSGMLTLAWGPTDDMLAAMLPTLRAAFEAVRTRLAEAKRRARQLDFADLEVHALRALEVPAVQAYYHARWKAFLIDEYQDTNPDQARMLRLLTAGARVTIVGDEKQAIYGFRRADASLFPREAAAIERSGGARTTLGRSFRTHGALVDAINQVFQPVLGAMHRDLDAARIDAPAPGPHLTLHTVDQDGKPGSAACRRVEAMHVARSIKALIDAGTPVHDKKSRTNRPMRPGDVAVLARAWAPLEAFAEAFAAVGLPAVHAGGGNLLETREALDGWAMLRVLANPWDSLALAAVLRGPWFAVSDRELLAFAQVVDGQAWWPVLRESAPPALALARDVLDELIRARRHEPPSRLLQMADRLCGLTAVVANLPGAVRREADWAGFVDFVRMLEGGGSDADMVVKKLARLAAAEIEVPRPALEAGDAVALMTIHKSKGLEWPVVVVPDLARKAPGDFKRVRFDAEAGVALRLEDEVGAALEPGLFLLLKAQVEARAAEEVRRLAYVALTRARDRLMLSAAGAAGGILGVLQPGLDAAGCVPAVIPFGPEAALPPRLLDPPARPLVGAMLTGPAGAGFTTLPVTALSTYARCPQAFKLAYVDGHPGYGEGAGVAARVGTLAHLALELDLFDPAALAPYDPGLPAESVAEAAALARAFHESPTFEDFRGGNVERERAIRLKVGKLTLRGFVDLVGADFVVDYKTDAVPEPEHHRLQVWAYATATGKSQAHLAYLRSGRLATFEGAELESAGIEAMKVVAGIARGDFEATPGPSACSRCSFQAACPSGASQVDEDLQVLDGTQHAP